MATPTVGRIVLFHETGGPYASLVTSVNADGTLELATFGKNSLYFQHGVKECPTVPPIAPEPGTWSWPPRT